MNSKCPICDGVSAEPFYTKYGFALVRCASCSTIFVSPQPPLEELTAHYQNEAHFAGLSEQGYRCYADMRKALEPHFERRLAALAVQLPQRGALLDFGCAAGYFLKIAQSRGWQVCGVELSTAMARQAEAELRVPVYTSLTDVPNGEYAAITLWEVIEHVPDPVATLSQLRERLRPGGVLMLSTPNNGHWQALRAPERWSGYRPPSHLLYFTRHTLGNSIERAGYTRVEISGSGPLPPLPAWLKSLSSPLQDGLTTARAEAWKLSLYVWRTVRAAGWAWQKVAHRNDGIYATIEAVAKRPT
jgi:2-polyprenyl-3-methyl-5-hydroxy-6-metoxy-1,4-benzoquinol methylase